MVSIRIESQRVGAIWGIERPIRWLAHKLRSSDLDSAGA